MNADNLPSTTGDDRSPASQGTDERLNEALRALIQARDEGDAQQVEALVEQYPDLRDKLLEMLDMESALGMDRLRQSALPQFEESSSYRKYDSWEEKSSGGYGVVFKARDRVLGRRVAIKLFKPELTNTSALARFLEEPQVASQLDHPGIAPIHEMGRMPDGRPFVAMKWVEGETLADRLAQKRSPRDLHALLVIFRQVCQTVAYAHKERGVLHRDLKPANVMLGSYGEVFVLDWGLSKVLLAREDESSPRQGPLIDTLRTRNPQLITQEGAQIGTWPYMSPEQARESVAAITMRSDVFGLGAILCEVLTGHPPYRGKTRAELMQAAQNAELGDAHARLEASGHDAKLIALGKTCLAVRPEDRPADAGEVADAITAYLDAVEMRAQRAAVENATLLARLSAFRWRVTAGIVFGLAVSGLLGAVTWYWLDQAARHAAEKARRAFREEKARDELGKLPAALRENRLAEARAALADALARLAEGGGEDLQEQARSAQRDLAFLEEVERLRQEQGAPAADLTLDGGKLTLSYSRAFQERGIDVSDGEQAAQVIRASPIRLQLLAALDHWALIESYPAARRKLLRIAQRASGPEQSWEWRFRDPELRRSPAALAKLAAQTSPEERSPVEIESLARALLVTGGNAEPLLRRGLTLYPADFWLNLLLALTLQGKGHAVPRSEERGKVLAEAIGYLRAALAVRPESAYARELLGWLLLGCGRFREAVPVLERAVGEYVRQSPSLNPLHNSVMRARYALARAQLASGDVQEAENTCADVLRLAPRLRPFVELHQDILRRKARR